MPHLLPPSTIRLVYKASVELGLHARRDALVLGLPRTFTATLGTLDDPGAQLLSDLYKLNDVGSLGDGTVPLREWLENALLLTEHQQQSSVLRDARSQLDREMVERGATKEEPAPAVRAAPTDPAAAGSLERLLLSLFSTDELRRFVRYLPDGAQMELALPGANASAAQVASTATEVLVRRGAVDAAFFTALEQERRGRKADIHVVRARFGI